MTEESRNKPLYMISVAAELTGMHPQTLRVYESKGLVNPKRSGGNTRLYSQADIERLELINQLTDEGINLAGVVRILDMKERAEERAQDAEEDYRPSPARWVRGSGEGPARPPRWRRLVNLNLGTVPNLRSGYAV